MPLRFLVLVAATALAAIAQPPPSPAEQSALIDEVRKNALAYDENLPNFICTQETRRSSMPVKAGDQKWKLLDTLTIRLSYFGRKEDYHLVAVNGKPANKGIDKVGGSRTNGDFGSMLHAVFREKSQTKFEWERWSEWKGRPAAVIKYAIDREHSAFMTSSAGFLHGNRVVWGAEGAIYVDRETHQILRLSVDSMDLPPSFPVREVHIALEYATQKIGDREYLLPAVSVSESVTARERRKSESRFTEYRKFSADTAIKFGEEKL